MGSEDIARKYYARINIKLPSLKKISVFLAAMSSLVFIRGFLAIGLEYFYIYLIYITLTLSVSVKTLKSSFFFASVTSVLYLLISLTLIPFIYSLGFMVPWYMYSFVTKFREAKAFILVLIPPLAPALIFIQPLHYYLYIISIVAISYLYLKYIGRKGEKILGMGLNSLNVVRPFLNSLMDKRSTHIEDFLNGISRKSLVRVSIFKLGYKYFVLPDIHYGMFDSVGSSRFIYDLESMVKDAIVLHGPSDHERDLPSRNESKKVVNAVRDAIYDKSDWALLDFYGIHFWKSGKFEATTLKFKDVSLTFLERPIGGIDDLPYTLWDFSESTGNYFVDTHNAMQTEEYTGKEIEKLKVNSMKIRAKEIRPLYLGYAEGALSTRCRGLCDNRVRFIAISDGTKKVGITYIYANNADEELTKRIKEELKDVYDKVIPITPDDHTCTATLFGFSKSLYDPARPCEDLIKLVKELGLIAVASMKPVNDIEYKGVKIYGIKTIGKIISSMTVALNEVGSAAMKTFWIPIIAPYLLLLVFLFFSFSSPHL